MLISASYQASLYSFHCVTFSSRLFYVSKANFKQEKSHFLQVNNKLRKKEPKQARFASYTK